MTCSRLLKSVRHPAGQVSNRFHPLRLPQLRSSACFTISHVTRRGDDSLDRPVVAGHWHQDRFPDALAAGQLDHMAVEEGLAIGDNPLKPAVHVADVRVAHDRAHLDAAHVIAVVWPVARS